MQFSMEKAAHGATISASVVAVVLLFFGVYQFNETQTLAQENLRNEREMKAVELFVKFNELQEERVASTSDNAGEAAYWRGNTLVAITESIYNLSEGNASWKATVEWMLNVQEPYLIQNPPNCNTYSAEFSALLKGRPVKLCT